MSDSLPPVPLWPRRRPGHIDWDFVKAALAVRRERRMMEEQGYRKHETDWEILRGGRMSEVILDAKVSQCGKYVWTKVGLKP